MFDCFFNFLCMYILIVWNKDVMILFYISCNNEIWLSFLFGCIVKFNFLKIFDYKVV